MAMVERVVSNIIKCLRCNDLVESVHTHDFKWCKCGKVAADGGKSYLRRVGHREDWIDLSETYEENVKMSWED